MGQQEHQLVRSMPCLLRCCSSSSSIYPVKKLRKRTMSVPPTISIHSVFFCLSSCAQLALHTTHRQQIACKRSKVLPSFDSTRQDGSKSHTQSIPRPSSKRGSLRTLQPSWRCCWTHHLRRGASWHQASGLTLGSMQIP